jgi:nitroimidazol reductase NimA-like FMN-containing flavoprotein (pyridoxamine 5'-phosphate oxidase superfamily)
MLNLIEKMILENNLCVLSTCRNNIPNSSLMNYIADENYRELYMITLKGSTKYLNIKINPMVSLLIDTRNYLLNESEEIKALTVYGKAKLIVDKNEREANIKLLTRKYNHLVHLAGKVDVCVIQVTVESFLLLNGVNDSYRINL